MSDIDRMLRVDHAGEVGAQAIYKGQLAVLGNHAIAPELRHMAAQEQVHLDTFNKLLPKYNARPSALLPVWQAAGFAFGALSALAGPKAAMAATVAVESVIAEHYGNQISKLEAGEVKDTITQFRAEELEHHDTGLAHDAEEAPLYALMTGVVKRGCKAAIWIAERV